MNSRHSFVNIDWLSTYMSVCVCVCGVMLVFWEPNRLSFLSDFSRSDVAVAPACHLCFCLMYPLLI